METSAFYVFGMTNHLKQLHLNDNILYKSLLLIMLYAGTQYLPPQVRFILYRPAQLVRTVCSVCFDSSDCRLRPAYSVRGRGLRGESDHARGGARRFPHTVQRPDRCLSSSGSSVGRAVDCRGSTEIHRSLVQIRPGGRFGTFEIDHVNDFLRCLA